MSSALADIVNAIVSVEVENSGSVSLGTGVVVRRRKKDFSIITCEHVVSNISTVTIRTRFEDENGKFSFENCSAKVTKINKKHDLAMLVLENPTPKIIEKLCISALCLSKDEPELYDRVLIAGNQNSLFGIVVDGRLQGLQGSTDNDEGDYVVSGMCVSGVSGGAITDMNGALLGIIKQMDRDGDNLVYNIGFATPLPIIRSFVRRSK